MVQQISRLLFSILLFNLNAQAQDFVNPVTAKMVKEADGYVLRFSDGREARYFNQVGKPMTGTVYMRQIENTCQPSLPLVRCQMDFDLQSFKLDVRWTKNPDASRLLKTMISSNHNFSPAQEQLVEAQNSSLTWYYLYATQARERMGLRQDRLNCENFDWLMQSENNPEQVAIQSWGAEVMFPNEETKVAENTTLTGAKGLTLKRSGQKTYEVTGIQLSYPGQKPGVFPPFVSPQVSNLTFYSSAHKKYCQVSFEMNITKIVGLITSDEYSKVDPETLKPAKLDYWQYQDFALPYMIRNLLTEGSKYEAK